MNAGMKTRPVGFTFPMELVERIDTEVDRLRRAHPDQCINRSQLVRHLVSEALRPDPAPRKRTRKPIKE